MSVSKKKETYSQAMARLEKIVSQINNNELEIDQLAEKIKEANEIIAFCESKLMKADREIEKILAEKQESEE
ncbi:exodeoxyribonuclease VII small subunit [uncultured Bacteroides sp.]|uniref:exodeoxyribonuclease VII small subunit n=1 Tax=uncultured Bacteroides sp. TaxID=162156 RepID=UPI002619A409|nr:exodeoxyribonuclease VII small subunit [uncultured Bacteroides sp.]